MEMGTFKSVLRFCFDTIVALGALACVLVWLNITPKDLRLMPLSHWVWLIAALILFAIAVGSSGRSLYLSTVAVQNLKAQHQSEPQAAKQGNGEQGRFTVADLDGSIHRVIVSNVTPRGDQKIWCDISLSASLSSSDERKVVIREMQLTAWPCLGRSVRTVELRSTPQVPFTIQKSLTFPVEATMEFVDDGSGTIPPFHLMCRDQYGAKHFSRLHGVTLPSLSDV